jgi:hypothetical protein
MKKLYSLDMNGQEVVSVEMDVPDFMPRTTLNREWLKGIITEEVANTPKPRRAHRAARPGRAVKVAA